MWLQKYWGSGTVGSETLRRSDRLQSNYKLKYVADPNKSSVQTPQQL